MLIETLYIDEQHITGQWAKLVFFQRDTDWIICIVIFYRGIGRDRIGWINWGFLREMFKEWPSFSFYLLLVQVEKREIHWGAVKQTGVRT